MAKKESKAGRQKNGTGSFYHRKDGYVEYKVYLGIGADGKPLRPSFYGKDEKDALQAYKDWVKNSGDAPIERVTTVSQWAEKWLDVYKKDQISYKSYKNYCLYVNGHIVPEIGKLKLESVRPAHIMQLYKKKSDLSASALKHIEIALNGIFETARDNRLCKENPASKVKPPEKIKKTPMSFGLREIDLMMSFAPNHKSGNLVLGLLYTAMREGELSALLWSDVHLDESYIEVCRTVAEVEPDKQETIVVGGKEKQRTQYGIKEIPKGNHNRYFALSSEAVEFFKGLQKTSVYVFPSLSASFMTPNQFREQYNQFFKALNKKLDADKAEYIKAHPRATESDLQRFDHIRMLSPHKCRHTYATHAIRSGVNMRIVQEQLGHQQITTTEIYTNVNIEDRKNNLVNLKY